MKRSNDLARDHAKEIVESAKAEAAEIVARAEREAYTRAHAKDVLRDEIAEMAVDIASKIVKREISAEDNRRSSRISSRRWVRQMIEGELVTSMPLDEDAMKFIEEEFSKMLGGKSCALKPVSTNRSSAVRCEDQRTGVRREPAFKTQYDEGIHHGLLTYTADYG